MSSKYKIEYDEPILKTLRKLDKQVASRIVSWLHERLTNCINPRLWGAALKGDLGEFWRYRIGDYRVLCKIEDTKLIVLVIEIEHRKQVYK